ncbi:hypothetical protein [Streptomyces sp. NPDC059753]|uniref:hypothetical protein n=1 Tax=Streptomyces sp. NPDC059753 TaxID=3346933 RepID=UPI0036507D3D
MPGPDLPPASQPMTVEALPARCPTSAHNSELIDGVLYFTGTFDERDKACAERTYPGRRALINSARNLEVHPSGEDQPVSVLDRHR